MYQINKGINRSIEFRGIKAQYIIYLAIGLVVLLLLFTMLYLVGLGPYVCMVIVLPCIAGLFIAVQHYSKKYGEHGLQKQSFVSRLPPSLRTTSRKFFRKMKGVQ